MNHLADVMSHYDLIISDEFLRTNVYTCPINRLTRKIFRFGMLILCIFHVCFFYTGRPCRNITVPNSDTVNVPGVFEDRIHIECNLGFSFTLNGVTRILEYDSECLSNGEWSKNITCEGGNNAEKFLELFSKFQMQLFHQM